MKTLKYLQVENRAGKLKLNDGVYKESADKLIEELETLYGPSAVAANMRIGDVVCSADDALDRVEVEINSPGGSVFEGQRIYNALREMSGRGVEITTTVNGLAASMGSVILMAGDNRQMTHGSRVMIHEASTIAWGDARTLRKNADLLEGISAEIAGIYAERTGGELDKIRNLMFAETWMTADEAAENGFVHTVLKDGKPRASFDTDAQGMTGILSKLFPGNENVEQIEAQLSEIESLRNDLTAAQGRIDELVPLAEANAQLQTDLTAAQAKLDETEKLAEANAQTITDLQAAVIVTNEKIELKASEMLAATGHPQPVPIEDDGAPAQGVLEKLNAITNPGARTRFYNSNRAEIIRAQSQLTKS